jgi:hypothetical protein
MEGQMRYRLLSSALFSLASLLIVGCGSSVDPVMVRNTVTEHIKTEQFVYVTDPRTGSTLQVDPATMQVQEAVEETSGGRHLVHVTFKGEDGANYGVGYYVKEVEGGGLAVDDVVTHMVGTEEVLQASDRDFLDAQQ